ncbi:hypothetical protein B0T19DRAFT_431061 [Cercophora scortea]|uniref:Uncharacterized protein n=1 Tax=Cercophora scortea TaxID=314031 RepID=A0AAE0I9R6_9PEZI|nr:hypothetical protein B0T19DRAFT_431061 [Cercophora scortea]
MAHTGIERHLVQGGGRRFLMIFFFFSLPRLLIGRGVCVCVCVCVFVEDGRVEPFGFSNPGFFSISQFFLFFFFQVTGT